MKIPILYVELKVKLVDNQSRLIWFLQFQNVLRELEQKKPQLDELVKTAENLRESPIRQHIPEKGKLDYSNIHKYYGLNLWYANGTHAYYLYYIL